jgi:hypothetical protein
VRYIQWKKTQKLKLVFSFNDLLKNGSAPDQAVYYFYLLMYKYPDNSCWFEPLSLYFKM